MRPFVVVLPSSRCSTLPHCYLFSWRRYCGIRWSLLSTQPNRGPFQSNPGPQWSTWSSRLGGPRLSETLCRAYGLYRWSTTGKMEAHRFCGQSQRWAKIGSLMWFLFLTHWFSSFVIYYTMNLSDFSCRRMLPVRVWWKEWIRGSSGWWLLPLSTPAALDWGLPSFYPLVIFTKRFLITRTLHLNNLTSLHFTLHWTSCKNHSYKQVRQYQVLCSNGDCTV